MHYAWSTLSYPTLLVSQTSGSECNCSGLHYNETEFVDGQLAGSVGVPGSNGGSVVALIFTRLVEFSVDRNNADASNVFNATEADNLQSYNYSSTSLDSSNLTWSYFPANNTFRGVDNTTRTGNDTLPFAFSITVRLSFNYTYLSSCVVVQYALIYTAHHSNGGGLSSIGVFPQDPVH